MTGLKLEWLLAAVMAGLAVGGAAQETREAMMVGRDAVMRQEAALRGVLQKRRFEACWKDTRTRGVGNLVHECPEGHSEEQALLCYAPCKSGYKGVGPVCWEECHSGSSDMGVMCKKDSKIHMKKSYGRGVGKPLVCGCHEEQDALFFGLCYPKCSKGFSGAGPVCWGECAGEFPVDGGALCCASKEACKAEIVDMAVKFPIAIAKAVRDGKDIAKEIADIKEAIEDAMGFVLPLCSEIV